MSQPGLGRMSRRAGRRISTAGRGPPLPVLDPTARPQPALSFRFIVDVSVGETHFDPIGLMRSTSFLFGSFHFS